MPQTLCKWQRVLADLDASEQQVGITWLTEELLATGDLYGFGRKRVAGVAYFCWLLPPAEQRLALAPLLGKLLLWIYAIDGVLDNCTDLDAVDTLHSVVEAAFNQPDQALVQDERVKSLLVGLSDLLATLNASYGLDSAATNLLHEQFSQEVREMGVETAWRLDGSWHGITVEAYLAVAAVSIAALLTTALALVAVDSGLMLWPKFVPAILQAGVVCRLTNDIATAGKERGEGGANALFLIVGEEQVQRRAAYALIEQAGTQMDQELAALDPGSDATYLGGILQRMCAVTVAMYHVGDFYALD